MDFDLFDCFRSELEREQSRRNARINQWLRDAVRSEKNSCKLLLLGTGESGKSTLRRQMRIIYDNGYTESERLKYFKDIIYNVVYSMQTMIDAMPMLTLAYDSEETARKAKIIRKLDAQSLNSLNAEQTELLLALWSDLGIQECYRRRREYQLTDSIKYYMTHLRRITASGYMPTDVDIVHVRIPTTGVIECHFSVENVRFHLIDVGGQRSERRKWLHFFDKVKAVIYMVATSEYDQTLAELYGRNRLEESCQLFHRLCKTPWFGQSAIMVFFNKTDLLQEKIMYSHLADYFPQYKGPQQDYEMAVNFIANMFLEPVTTRKLYRHFTCATDTENIKIVFIVVRDTIFRNYMGNILH